MTENGNPVNIVHPVPTKLKGFVKDMQFQDGVIWYIDHDGCYWNDLGELLQGSKKALDLCLCGDFTENLRLIGGVLLHLRDRLNDGYQTPNWLAENPLINFIYYWLDARGFTEHGGSIPGWLSPTGHQLLLALAHWDELEEAEAKAVGS